MNSSTTKVLNFGGFSKYYNYMSYYDGYGGFNYFADFFYMNDSTWTNPNGVGYQYGWCDTGYQNVAAMSGAHSLGWIYSYGLLDTTKGQTFTLNSMDAAASFSKNAVWDIISYTENNGALYVKATDELKISYTGKHVKMSTLGAPGDFKNIAGVGFALVSYGRGGNACTYGYPVTGPQLAIGNFKVTFSGKSHVQKDGTVVTPHLQLHQLQPGAQPGALRPGELPWGDGGGGQHAGPHDGGGYHTHLQGAEHQAAASQFHLPAIDHVF